LHELDPLGFSLDDAHDPQPALRVGQEDPGCVGWQELDAVTDETVEQIDDVVVVVDQRVGQPDEGPDQQLLPAGSRLIHRSVPSRSP
jgi:hypothetical protein